MQETYGSGPIIADRLGYYLYLRSSNNSVLSRYPLVETPHATPAQRTAWNARDAEATLVVADAPISTPPIVSETWAALAMHHRYWEALRPKLRPGGIVAVNSTLFEGELDREGLRVLDVPATRIATDQGAPLSACLVLVSAFANATALLWLDSLLAGMRESVPPYRRQHLEANEKALRAGFTAASAGMAPAFPERATA